MRQTSRRKNYTGGTSIKRGYHTASRAEEQKYRDMERMTNEFLLNNGFNLDGSPKKHRQKGVKVYPSEETA